MSNQEKTILVVEDERPLLEAIKKKLELNDFSVLTARTVKQALGYLKDVKPLSAIWLDHYLLGKQDGLDFVAQVKKDGADWKKIPIFVVSNTASASKVRSYLQLGVTKYYTKTDYRLDQIINDLKKFLNHQSKE